MPYSLYPAALPPLDEWEAIAFPSKATTTSDGDVFFDCTEDLDLYHPHFWYPSDLNQTSQTFGMHLTTKLALYIDAYVNLTKKHEEVVCQLRKAKVLLKVIRKEVDELVKIGSQLGQPKLYRRLKKHTGRSEAVYYFLDTFQELAEKALLEAKTALDMKRSAEESLARDAFFHREDLQEVRVEADSYKNIAMKAKEDCVSMKKKCEAQAEKFAAQDHTIRVQAHLIAELSAKENSLAKGSKKVKRDAWDFLQPRMQNWKVLLVAIIVLGTMALRTILPKNFFGSPFEL